MKIFGNGPFLASEMATPCIALQRAASTPIRPVVQRINLRAWATACPREPPQSFLVCLATAEGFRLRVREADETPVGSPTGDTGHGPIGQVSRGRMLCRRRDRPVGECQDRESS